MQFSMLRALLAAVLLCVLANSAHSQWTVTYLHPAGAIQSYAYGVSAVDVVGEETASGLDYHAARWTGSAASFVDLNPAGARSSTLYGTDGVHQVGSASGHAGIWSGTAASFVDLHPSGHSQNSFSVAYSVQGNLQAGVLAEDSNSPYLPASWNSTAASYANISTATGYGSSAYILLGNYGTDGVSIVGTTMRPSGNPQHAGLWKFGPDSFTDLNPVNATDSGAYAVDGNLQVGYAAFASPGHAALWKGTAASFTDLNPAGASNGSVLYGVSGGYEVGYAMFGSTIAPNAGIWSGTPGSFVNLHSFLSPDFLWSEAQAVWTDGTTIRVAGWGIKGSPNGGSQAILWTLTVPEPACLPIIAGIFSAAAWRWPRTSRLRRYA